MKEYRVQLRKKNGRLVKEKKTISKIRAEKIKEELLQKHYSNGCYVEIRLENG